MGGGGRLGFWAAIAETALGTAYLATGVAWLVVRIRAAGPALQPGEPYLSILEFLLLVSAPVMVVLMAAVHVSAPRERKGWTLSALGLTAVFAALTAGNRFVRLTVARQVGPADLPALLQPYRWPGVPLALDFLAWGLFLGLALLLAAPAFGGNRLRRGVRVSMVGTGACCLVGAVGPLVGDLRFTLIGIAGWSFGLVVVCSLLAAHFASGERSETGGGGFAASPGRPEKGGTAGFRERREDTR